MDCPKIIEIDPWLAWGACDVMSGSAGTPAASAAGPCRIADLRHGMKDLKLRVIVLDRGTFDK